MSRLDEHIVEPQDISTGLTVLHKRQRKLQLSSFATATLFMISLFVLLNLQNYIYGFIGLAPSIQQLHLPLSVDSKILEFQNQPDYLLNLFKWFGWFFLKLIVAFIGSFVVISILKKFHFFYVRFQSFVLKFVGWLIAFIIMWTGLTLVQYNSYNDEKEAEYELVHYDQHIQQSEIYKLLDESDTDAIPKAYVLAQTALLHQPQDINLARSYVAELVKSERTNKNFVEYGFSPEQLWTMQHQIYDKAITPTTQDLQVKVDHANQYKQLIKFVLMIISAVLFVISMLIFLLSNRLKKRVLRIQQQVH